MLSPLQNCSEGGLVKAELNYDAATTSNFALSGNRDCAIAFTNASLVSSAQKRHQLPATTVVSRALVQTVSVDSDYVM